MHVNKTVPVSEQELDLAEQVNSEHYIKQVTSLGDQIELVAGEDILTRTFHKLIGQGTRIDSSFYERLIRHKLLKPIDRSLVSSETVNSSTLVAEATRLIHHDELLRHMFRGFPELPYQIMRTIELENELALKLTVAREALPHLFNHSMIVTLVAIYLGMRAQKGTKELTALALAGLLHDIGELHLDLDIQDRSRPLDDQAWQQIYAHPFISYLILKEFPRHHPRISTAVLDHHERLDGSGYPRNLVGDAINELGHILAVAELAAGVASSIVSRRKVEARLKLNTRKYKRQYVSYLLDIYKGVRDEYDRAEGINQKQLSGKVERLHKVYDHWKTIIEKLNEQQRHQELVVVVESRLQVLRRELAETGIDVEASMEMYAGMGEDYAWMNETNAVLDEALYQIRRIVEEIKWRWPGYKEEHKTRSLGQYLNDWLLSARELAKI